MPHPIMMHGINIPDGTAEPEERLVNINHMKVNIKAFPNRMSRDSDMKARMVFA